MTAAIRERVARAMRARLSVNILRHAPQVSHEWLRELSEALADDAQTEVRVALLEEVAAPLWTVANHDTYAVLHRPDGSAAARFHVIAECEAVARVLNGAMRVGGGAE